MITPIDDGPNRKSRDRCVNTEPVDDEPTGNPVTTPPTGSPVTTAPEPVDV